MKTYFLPIIALFFSHFSLAQTQKTVLKVVPIHTNQNFIVNSSTNVGGKTRTYYKIDLPPNTVEWYYVFSTTPISGNNHTINLVSQLSKLVDPTGITSIATQLIFVPSGTGICDIYLLDRNNLDKFTEKNAFSYKISGMRENYKQGIAKITDITQGTWFLGFKNPSFNTGIKVNLEVAAVVKETIYNFEEWSAKTKREIYDNLYPKFTQNGLAESDANNLTNCIIDKMVQQKTYSEVLDMTDDQERSYVKDLAESCVKNQQPERNSEQQKGITYGNLGWKSYENGDIDKGIEYSKKALTFDKTLGYVKANLGLFYLIKGDEGTATDYYVEAISDFKHEKFKTSIKKYLQSAFDDINNALIKYPNIKGSKDIKDLLEIELKNY